ncbi:MAG TPA: alpha/beta fold hydrolase [archaeon]|nr:alpha/beta fold hydrolase [archaeon]
MQKPFFAFFLLAALVLFFGCIQQSEKGELTELEGPAMEKVSFQTNDGVTIAANFFSPKKSNGKAVILLHMMPAVKESWNAFAKKLTEKGFTVIAPDLRGHGESNKKGNEVLDFQKFSDKEHKESIQDVYASMSFLEEKGFQKENTFIIGASIGANLALQFAAENPEIKRTALLSPGLDYRGVNAEKFIEKFKGSLFIASSKEDAYSYSSSETLAKKSANAVNKQYNNAGHGTTMFNSTDLMNELLEWIAK